MAGLAWGERLGRARERVMRLQLASGQLLRRGAFRPLRAVGPRSLERADRSDDLGGTAFSCASCAPPPSASAIARVAASRSNRLAATDLPIRKFAGHRAAPR